MQLNKLFIIVVILILILVLTIFYNITNTSFTNENENENEKNKIEQFIQQRQNNLVSFNDGNMNFNYLANPEYNNEIISQYYINDDLKSNDNEYHYLKNQRIASYYNLRNPYGIRNPYGKYYYPILGNGYYYGTLGNHIHLSDEIYKTYKIRL